MCQLYEIPFVRSNFNPLLGLLLGAGPIFLAAKQVTENFWFKVGEYLADFSVELYDYGSFSRDCL